MKELEGKIIYKVYIDYIKENIAFLTDSGFINYTSDADCCSESWINHISGLECLFGNVINKTDRIDLEDIQEGQPGFSGRQEVDSVYLYKLFTKDGVCEIDFRNASNGYYGGSLQFFHGEVKWEDSELLTDNF